MKTNRNNGQRSAFTLIEMVGVLAVIAILAALLVPKIFAAINDSRFSNSVASINSAKTAAMDYFGKKSSFPIGATAGLFGTTLLTEGFLERPFTSKIGETPTISVWATTAAVPGETHCYTLDGTVAIPIGSTVVEIVLNAVEADDAWELSKRIDGDALPLTPATAITDTKGRVTYNATTKVCSIYLAHK